MLFGVMIPLVLVAWPKPLARLGAIGVYPAIEVLAWVIAWGGRGRETAIIGAVASIGLLAAEPLARWLKGHPPLQRFPKSTWGAPLAGTLQALVVLGTARFAGLQSNLVAAAGIAIAALSAATIALALSPYPKMRRH